MTNMPNTIRKALAIFAILGIATFMLTACLGGGGGNGGCEGPLCITPDRYAAFAFDRKPDGRYVWDLATGDEDVLSEVRNRCAMSLDTGSRCEHSASIRNGCAAIAVSESGALGGATGNTREEAENNAIAACGRGDSSDTCRLDTSRTDSPAVVCA